MVGEKVGREKGEGFSAKRVKVNPSPIWKKRLSKWMGTARWAFNPCIRLVKDKKVEAWDIKNLRARVIAVHNCGQIKPMIKSSKRTRKKKKRQMVKLRKQRQKSGDATAWVIETPMEIRDAAAMDLVKSFRCNPTKRKKNPNHF